MANQTTQPTTIHPIAAIGAVQKAGMKGLRGMAADPDLSPPSKPRRLIRFLSKKFNFLREKILNDLEEIFRGALASGHYPSAIKAKELQGRELGLLKDTKDDDKPDLTRLSDGELKKIIDTL